MFSLDYHISFFKYSWYRNTNEKGKLNCNIFASQISLSFLVFYYSIYYYNRKWYHKERAIIRDKTCFVVIWSHNHLTFLKIRCGFLFKSTSDVLVYLTYICSHKMIDISIPQIKDVMKYTFQYSNMHIRFRYIAQKYCNVFVYNFATICETKSI